jgi:hypothetical protein
MITTGQHPAMARRFCDVAYVADDFGIDVTAFMQIKAEFEPADRSVGEPGGYGVTAQLVGAQIGQMVLSAEDARKALEGNVAYLERCAADDAMGRYVGETPRWLALADAGDAAWAEGRA